MARLRLGLKTTGIELRRSSLAAAFLRSFVAPGAAITFAIAGFVVQAPVVASAAGRGCATPGNDGPNAALTGVVNTYYPAIASAAAGATTISVGAPIGAAQPIAAGDLLLVIQMQDADINGANTVAYGDGTTGRGSTNLHSTGLYEYVAAASAVVAGVVTLGNGLANSYDFSTTVTGTSGFKTFQVIRVPQYSSATLGAGLTATAWNGGVHAGGVVAIDVAGDLNLNTQTISVNQLGFKGGLGVQQNGPANGATGTDYVVISLHGQHGYKAEGIAGTPHFLYDAIAAAAVTGAADGYPGGDAARGAPGNAGGGGTDSSPTDNQENSGGGGGANGGQGGLGGNTWRSIQPVGGLGGAAFLANATKVVLGGGGGAGTRNNSSGFMSSGGTGGGMVMIRTGSVSGTGIINANGGVGVTPLNDGGGGGGAGGSVVVSATSAIAGLTINAIGGRGTDAWPADAGGAADYHGPGGGGSGGVIIASSGPGGTSVLGGAHGTTTTNLNAYGSIDGAVGVVLPTTPGAIPGSSSGAECLPLLTVTKTTSTPSVTNTAGGTTATYSITVGNAANTAPATGIAISDALPAGFTYLSTGSLVLNAGATRTAVVNPAVGDTNPAFGAFTIPGAGSVVITFSVHIAAGVPNGTYSNPATATYLSPTRTTVSGTTSGSYPGGGPERVAVGTPADIAVTKTVSNPTPTVGANVTFTITATNNGPSNATGVQVTDPVPGGLTLVSATPSAGTSYTAGTGIWNIGALANGAGATLAIVATVNTTTATTNTATKSAEFEFDPNAGNNSASATVTGLPGLPNTSAPFGGLAPREPADGWLTLLSTVVVIGATCLAAITIRGNRPRFRRRRSRTGVRSGRLTLVASAALVGMVFGFASAGQLENYATPRSISLSAVAGATDTIVGRPTADTELIGSRYVTKAPPPPPAAETFHYVTSPITPARLRIPSIGVDARVDGIGLRPDGSMDVPDNLWTSSWLSTGPRPGQAGKSVIAGHRGIGTPALFSHLEDVQAGDRIYISDAVRGQLVFEVTRIASLDLSNATQVEVFGPTAQQQLVLITCYGKYMAGSRTYDHRLVVFSRLLPPT